MRLLPLLILLASCQDSPRGPASVEEGSFTQEELDLQIHVKSFYSKMGAAGFNNSPRNIEYIFSYSMDPQYAGYCDYPSKPGGPYRVTINMTYWTTYSATEKEILVYHELGHCVLNRSHVSTKDSSGREVSLMHPTLLYQSTYKPRKAYYVQELFANAKIPKGTGSGYQAAKSMVIKETYDEDESAPTHRCE